MKQLGPKTRQDLRRQERRLAKEAGGSLDSRTYHEPKDVGAFIAAAQEVSQKTYQRHLLGMGVRDDEKTRNKLGAAARAGWLRSYGLFCRGQPIAFMHGYLYGGTYYSEEIGYDPAWSDWSVGNVLHSLVVKDLIEVAHGVRQFDFLYGDNPNKQRLSNAARLERNFYLIPSSFRNMVLVYSIRAFNGLAEGAGRLLDRWGLRSWLRRVVRKRSIPRDRAEQEGRRG
jgi:CelD/BcsL family acetyltransferase involved in cellulose biosynthesis